MNQVIAGQHHLYMLEHASAYIDEAIFKYNTRRSEMPFGDFMLREVGVAEVLLSTSSPA